MNINPNEVVKRGIIHNIQDLNNQIQQNGIDLTIKQAVTIPSKGFVNVEVNEKFDMQNTFGIINIRSSLSRKGIFSTSGIYDSGFKGVGGVSLYNMSDDHVVLEKGTRIAQMIVFGGNPASMYDGHYNESGSIKSKLEEE